jgi:hypothetical protein
MPVSLLEYVKFFFDVNIGIYLKVIRVDFSTAIFMLGMDVILIDCLINAYLFGGFYLLLLIVHSFLVKVNKLRWLVEVNNRGL